MIQGTFLTFVPFLLGLLAVQPSMVGTTVTRLIEQDEVIMRVPISPHPVVGPIEWQERKGPRCIPVAMVGHALLSGPQQVDFVLGNHRRVRAEMDEDCPALDFYGGFYLQLEDERLCAGRDEIRSRMGGSCTIARFKMLVPKVHREQ